jgi:hypothetical protein
MRDRIITPPDSASERFIRVGQGRRPARYRDLHPLSEIRSAAIPKSAPTDFVNVCLPALGNARLRAKLAPS